MADRPDTICSDSCSASIAELFTPLTNTENFEVTRTRMSHMQYEWAPSEIREGLKVNLTKYLDRATTVHPGYYCLLDHFPVMTVSVQPSTLMQPVEERTQRVVVDCLQEVRRIVCIQSQDSDSLTYRYLMFKIVLRFFVQRV